jgi:iron complex transport system ATP-binding protein
MMRFDRVCAGYGGVPCLHEISASLREGELIGLIGPNGSGKSTLLKVAAGQLAPNGGGVYLGEACLCGLSVRQIARKIAYMPQSRAVPNITVRQLAAHGRYPHLGLGRAMSKGDWAIVDAAMETAGIARLADRTVSDLSGGERQRAYIAMALSQHTEVLLLDEPAAHLDMAHQFALMEMLSRLKSSGKTVVVVLHELALALTYCDRLLLLDRGRLVLCAAPKKALSSGMLETIFGIRIHAAAEGGYTFAPR